MPNIFIDNVDFSQLAAEKYWSLPRNKSNPKEELYKMVYSGMYAGSEKKDGAYMRLVKGDDGEISWQGRSKSTVTKDYLDKKGHCPQLQEFFDKLPNGTCLLGEAYYPKKSGSSEVTKILGCKEDTALKRQENPAYGKLHYWVFDVWAFDGKSFLNTTYKDRIEFIKNELSKYKTEYVEIADFFFGEDIIDNFNKILSKGGEGVVITKLDSVPSPGKRTARKTLKVKQELSDTVDVVIMAPVKPTRVYNGKNPESWEYWINERTNELRKDFMYVKAQIQHEGQENDERGVGINTWVPVTKRFFYGWASGFSIGAYKDGELVKIGQVSGLTDDVAEHWRDYIGTVLEITCMQTLETGGLRHPRIMNYRSDKDPKECLYEDIFR